METNTTWIFPRWRVFFIVECALRMLTVIFYLTGTNNYYNNALQLTLTPRQEELIYPLIIELCIIISSYPVLLNLVMLLLPVSQENDNEYTINAASRERKLIYDCMQLIMLLGNIVAFILIPIYYFSNSLPLNLSFWSGMFMQILWGGMRCFYLYESNRS
jgi:hypothetical protein